MPGGNKTGVDSSVLGAHDEVSLARSGKERDETETTEEFVHRQNVRRYIRQLAAAADKTRRKQLMALLAEERARSKAQGWTPLFD